MLPTLLKPIFKLKFPGEGSSTLFQDLRCLLPSVRRLTLIFLPENIKLLGSSMLCHRGPSVWSFSLSVTTRLPESRSSEITLSPVLAETLLRPDDLPRYHVRGASPVFRSLKPRRSCRAGLSLLASEISVSSRPHEKDVQASLHGLLWAEEAHLEGLSGGDDSLAVPYR